MQIKQVFFIIFFLFSLNLNSKESNSIDVINFLSEKLGEKDSSRYFLNVMYGGGLVAGNINTDQNLVRYLAIERDIFGYKSWYNFSIRASLSSSYMNSYLTYENYEVDLVYKIQSDKALTLYVGYAIYNDYKIKIVDTVSGYIGYDKKDGRNLFLGLDYLIFERISVYGYLEYRYHFSEKLSKYNDGIKDKGIFTGIVIKLTGFEKE